MVLLHLKNHHNQEEEAFPVFFPKPAIAKSNIEGHMIEQTARYEKNFAISVSVQTNPATIINKPDIPKA
jgi:hypothetical protein